MNKQALVTHLQIEVEELEVWLAQAWIVPADTTHDETPADLEFTPADVARAHLIKDLKATFGVNDPGVDIVLHLLDQLHGVRRAFEGLRAEARGRVE